MVAMMSEKMQQMLSKMATGGGHGEDSPYFDGWKAYDSDPYHPIDNPQGVIQMGLAENQLCFDLVQDWITKNPQASICSAQGVNEFGDVAIFQDYHGLPAFRKAVANFMEITRGNRVRFDPDRIVMGGGATGVHETLAFCLADPGDAFLVPTPYYPGYDRDLRWRTGVQLVPVVCESHNNFNVTKEALETAYENAQKSNIKIKGLLISNPSNPLGTFLDKETLKTLVTFINEKNIHFICDEIYAATVFEKGQTGNDDFISVAEILNEQDVKCNPDLIHMVYSLSKDMGFPGFRVGILYSYNDDVVSCARKMSSFGLVSTQTQHLMAAMLSDNEFVENFIRESSGRLATRHSTFSQGLAKVGINSLKSNAGLFLWMDLHQLLKEKSYESEMELWRLIIKEVKLNVSPGSSFHCSEPGWFRVCFANMDEHTMEVALARIRNFMTKINKEAKKPVKKLCWQRSLRLSFSGRRFDDIMMSSPHSPISQSPLVRART